MSIVASPFRTLALALLIGGFAVGSAHAAPTSGTTLTHTGPAMMAKPAAATPTAKSDEKATTGTASSEVTSDESSGMPKRTAERVEERIKTLHDKLNITAAEEDNWSAFASTMRNNEADISRLIKERHKNAKDMTAVEDLQSYQKIAQAHVDGLTKLTSAFETLYNSMSAEQKKNADEVFGHFEGHAWHHKKGEHKPAEKKAP
ncbi:MAG TPA: Spy/CpxP family protein refolding chaperone [Alphaproteobacteria bacterium]|nr:Spy/CpxP family protein refolding chaperone [Alphaproteobacteria bacterium]